MSNHLKFYINGAWVDPVTPRKMDVINPATEEPFTAISIGSAADVDRAVAAAKAAFPKFSQTSKAERIALLKVDIEGSEADLFADADPSLLARIDRVAMEYHNNLRPGTLDLLKHRLGSTHDLVIQPADGCDCGILLDPPFVGYRPDGVDDTDYAGLGALRPVSIGPMPDRLVG